MGGGSYELLFFLSFVHRNVLYKKLLIWGYYYYVTSSVLEPPNWVIRGAEVDILCKEDGIWYDGRIKQMGVNGRQVLVQLSYRGYDGIEQHNLEDCKYFQ